MYKNIFSIDNRPNWADEIFVIKNSKMHRYVYMPQKTLMVKKLSLLFMINTKQTVFSAENVIKKGDNLYLQWKGYNNSFKSWINVN